MAELALEVGSDPQPAPVRARPRRRPIVIGEWAERASDEVDRRIVGNRIADVVDARGLRWPWVAAKMGYHRTYFTRVVRGERPVTREFARRAVIVLDLPYNMLFILAPAPPEED